MTRGIASYRRELSVAGVYALVLVAMRLIAPQFFHGEFRETWIQSAPVLVAAAGMTLVIVARQIDISIGSQFSICGVAAGLLAKAGLPMPAVAVLTIGIGVLMGAFNGLLVAFLELPSIIVTLGTLNLYRGLTFIISDARQVDRQYIPSALKAMSTTSPILGIPWIIFMALGVALLTYWFASHTRVGRQVFALGSNPAAAPLRLGGARPIIIRLLGVWNRAKPTPDSPTRHMMSTSCAPRPSCAIRSIALA